MSSELGYSVSSSFSVGSSGTTRSERVKVPLAPGKSLYDWLRRAEAIPRRDPGALPTFTADEVLQHNKVDDAWTSFQGHVFDVTEYMAYHPGGAEQLMRCAGRDMTDLFTEVHPWVNMSLLKPCLLGKLAPSAGSALAGAGPPGGGAVAMRGGPPPNLQCTLTEFKKVTEDTVELTFCRPPPAGAESMPPPPGKPASATSSAGAGAGAGGGMGVQINVVAAPTAGAEPGGSKGDGAPFKVGLGQHVSLRAKIKGRIVTRPYTPVGDDPSELRLLVKLYDDGAMSKHLAAMKVGDSIGRTEPSGEFPALFARRAAGREPFDSLCIVAAGTGITPFPRIWRAALQLDSVKRVRVVTVNRTRADALLVDTIESERAQGTGQGPTDDRRFDALHLTTREEELPSGGGDGSPRWRSGRFTEEIAREFFPEPSRGTLACVCGPVLMVKETVRALVDAGFKADNIHEFV